MSAAWKVGNLDFLVVLSMRPFRLPTYASYTSLIVLGRGLLDEPAEPVAFAVHSLGAVSPTRNLLRVLS